MPRRVLLRVKLDVAVFGDSAVVVQDSALIPRQPDSSYVVDFMKLRMDVYPKGTVAVLPTTRFRKAAVDAQVSGKVLRVRGLPAGSYVITLHTASGVLVERGGMRVAGTGEDAVSFRNAPRPGLHQLSIQQSAQQGAAGQTRKFPLLILQ
jgi:hypothetical protein